MKAKQITNKNIKGCGKHFKHKKEGKIFNFICGDYCLCSECVIKNNIFHIHASEGLGREGQILNESSTLPSQTKVAGGKKNLKQSKARYRKDLRLKLILKVIQ
jgi:hypothetical protein